MVAVSVRKCSRYITGTHRVTPVTSALDFIFSRCVCRQRLSQTGVSANAPSSESTIDTVQQEIPPGIDANEPRGLFCL